jgi:hypothetical protein
MGEFFAVSPPDNIIDVCHKAGVPHKRLSKEMGARIGRPMMPQLAQCKRPVVRQIAYDSDVIR